MSGPRKPKIDASSKDKGKEKANAVDPVAVKKEDKPVDPVAVKEMANAADPAGLKEKEKDNAADSIVLVDPVATREKVERVRVPQQYIDKDLFPPIVKKGSGSPAPGIPDINKTTDIDTPPSNDVITNKKSATKIIFKRLNISLPSLKNKTEKEKVESSDKQLLQSPNKPKIKNDQSDKEKVKTTEDKSIQVNDKSKFRL